MAVKIRLKRIGAKKNPFYRVVVSDSRKARDGRFIEELGYYDPLSNEKTFKIDNERALYWLSTGAQPTSIVDKLFKDNAIYNHKTKETPVVEETIEVEEAEVEQTKEVVEEEQVEESTEEKTEESDE